jgi:hypothetical protein
VLCTYGYVFQMHFYKYYAAVPLKISQEYVAYQQL